MSDGPHRSLPMRRWWKQAAMRAEKSAFDVNECTAAIEVALARELGEELTPSFVQGLRDAYQEPGLFSPGESLKSLNPGTPLERRVLNNLAVPSVEQSADVTSLLAAFSNAIRNEAPRFNKQIEEHYLRKSGPGHAKRERERLEEATARADIDGLARKLLQPDGLRTAPPLKKKMGLDDGVTL
ncbi:MAG: hypothetical protein WEB90_02950 [Gemmatimonadota bacterium]